MLEPCGDFVALDLSPVRSYVYDYKRRSDQNWVAFVTVMGL